jgi:uncharacterized protein DUF6572
MSVEQEAVVDAIGVETGSGTVVLTISDHLQWDESNEHLLTLQNKINRYLAFIESGELLKKYPNAEGRPVRIDVVCMYEPTPIGRAFLSRAESTIISAGVSFGWRVLAA